MSDYSVSLSAEIDFAPETTVAEVIQNVRTILATRKGTVPLDRDFGVSWEHLDKPLNLAMPLMKAGIIDAIEEFEPRAKVKSVDFEDDTDNAMEGILQPKVVITIEEDDE